jgi:hypothetical protein
MGQDEVADHGVVAIDDPPMRVGRQHLDDGGTVFRLGKVVPVRPGMVNRIQLDHREAEAAAGLAGEGCLARAGWPVDSDPPAGIEAHLGFVALRV